MSNTLTPQEIEQIRELLRRAQHGVNRTAAPTTEPPTGLTHAEVEQSVFWDAVTLDAMARWRVVHIPIFVVFAVLALGHIVSVLLFWGWR